MKIGKIPVVAIVVMVIYLSRFVAKHIFHMNVPGFDSPFNAGLLIGVVTMDLIYRVQTWVLAWKNNKKEVLSTLTKA
jgi:hypothetical protein